MILPRLKIVGMLGAGLWLVACSIDPAQNPAWELAGHPGLLYDVQLFYEPNALEENGRCTSPLFQGVARSEVLAEDDKQLIIALTYRYRDSMRDERRLGLFRECEGFARRTFTIAKNGDELTVIGMTGPQKLRRAPQPVAPQRSSGDPDSNGLRDRSRPETAAAGLRRATTPRDGSVDPAERERVDPAVPDVTAFD